MNLQLPAPTQGQQRSSISLGQEEQHSSRCKFQNRKNYLAAGTLAGGMGTWSTISMSKPSSPATLRG